MNILITGATGQLGSKIVQKLIESKQDEHLIVSVRDPKKADHLRKQGVEVRFGDFDDPASLTRAFAGVDYLLVISTDAQSRAVQHANAVEAAKQAQVKRIFYTSVVKADRSPLQLSHDHKATEDLITASGIPYIIFRNNWYLENEIDVIKGALSDQTITTTQATGRVGWMLRDEYAQAIANSLLGAGTENSIYTITNKPHTIDELASSLAEITGKSIAVNHISDEQLTQTWQQNGLPDALTQFVIELNQSIRKGALDVSANDFEILAGRPAKNLKESLTILLESL